MATVSPAFDFVQAQAAKVPRVTWADIVGDLQPHGRATEGAAELHSARHSGLSSDREGSEGVTSRQGAPRDVGRHRDW